MIDPTLLLIVNLLVSTVIPIAIATWRRHPAIESTKALTCDEIRAEYTALERRLFVTLAGPRIAMEDIRTVCYDALQVPLDELNTGTGKRDAATAVLVMARHRAKLLDIWKAIARARPDLLENI